MDALEITILLVMGLIIGPAVGNYATSVIYRLPLGQTPFERHPYCGDCNNMLSPRDLFPIFSYLLLHGKCRHCGVSIRPSYTVVEISCGVLFAANLAALGFGEPFLLLCALGTFWIILAALEYHQSKFYALILTFCFFLAAMWRLMVDGSFYPMVQSSFLLMFVAIALSQLFGKRLADPAGYRVPNAAVMAALAGIALPLPEAAIALALALALYGLQRLIWGWRMVSGAAGLSVWLMLLYAQSSISLY